jgi:hypothetical protein
MSEYSGKKESKAQKFFKDNKSLAFMLPVLVVLIIVLLYIYVFSGMFGSEQQVSAPPTTNPTITTPSGESSQMTSNTDVGERILNLLPIRERALSDSELQKDPFRTSQYQLKGIVYSEKGNSCCVISAGGVSYILEKNGEIDDVLKVIEIRKETVTVEEVGGNRVILSLFE